MANLTMIGLYEYDNSLFDNLTFPEGIDKDTAVNEILMRSGEFEVLYSSFAFNKSQIGRWGVKHYRTFEKWINALSLEYNPLENYDRSEEWTDTNTGTQTTTNTGTQTTTNTGTETTTNTGTQTSVNSGSETNVKTGSDENVKTGSEKDEADNGNTTEVQVAAYDTATYSNKEKTIFDTDQTGEHTYNDVTDTHTYNDLTDTHTLNDLTNERTDNLTAERTDDLTEERTDDLTAERTDDLEGHHEGHVHGNIGVTTSQQMLQSELDIARFNIYENIADLFIDEFCILIY